MSETICWTSTEEEEAGVGVKALGLRRREEEEGGRREEDMAVWAREGVEERREREMKGSLEEFSSDFSAVGTHAEKKRGYDKPVLT